MKKPGNAVRFLLILCASLLLNIGGSAAQFQFELPQGETSKSDRPDIQDDTIIDDRSEFIMMAHSGGGVVQSVNAQAFFFGAANRHVCFTLTNVIECKVDGPIKVLLEYKGDHKFFEVGAEEDAFCYTGRRGIFCDHDENHIDAVGGSNPPAEVIDMNLERGDYSIEFGPYNNPARCMSGYKAKLCIAFGPVHIDLTHEGTSSTYELDEDMNAICYLGRLGSFCDVYEAAGD